MCLCLIENESKKASSNDDDLEEMFEDVDMDDFEEPFPDEVEERKPEVSQILNFHLKIP